MRAVAAETDTTGRRQQVSFWGVSLLVDFTRASPCSFLSDLIRPLLLVQQYVPLLGYPSLVTFVECHFSDVRIALVMGHVLKLDKGSQ